MKDRIKRTKSLRSSRRLRKTCAIFSVVSIAFVCILSTALIFINNENSRLVSYQNNQSNPPTALSQNGK
ncbi:MAG: hypothetical protein WCR67_02380 [Bacilli bacterium]